MRLIACAVILAGCGYLGAVFAGAFKKRTESLMLMSDALRQLEFDIDFLGITLAESFERIAFNFDGAVGQVFEYTAARMKKKKCSDFLNIWNSAISAYGGELYLRESDRSILAEFARNLGAGDRESEKNNIRAALMRLKLAEDEARSEEKRNVKMYRGLGFLFGVFAVIVLI